MRLNPVHALSIATLSGLAIAGCNLALGLGGYDFTHGTGGTGTTSSSSSTSGSVGGGGASSSSSSGTGGMGGDGGPDADGGGGAPNIGGTGLWSFGFGGTGATISVAAMALDASGNIYLTGSYQGTVTLNGACTAGLPGPDAATQMAYLLKLDPSGTCIWATSHGVANGTTAGTALAVSPTGTITFAGTYNTSGTQIFGGPSLAATAIDSFVVRYPANFDPTQNSATWTQHLGDTGDQVITSIALDGSDDVYVAGAYTTRLKTLIGTPSIDMSGGSSKSGFALLLSAGTGAVNTATVRTFDSAGANVVADTIAFSATGYVAVGGRSGGDLNYGPGTSSAMGANDAFFAKYASLGLTYAVGSGAWLSDQGEQRVRQVGFDGAGSIYLSGNIIGNVDFMNGVTLSSTSSTAFLAYTNDAGVVQKALAFGIADFSNPLSGARFALDQAGDVVFAGTLQGKVDVLGESVSTATSSHDVVVGRVDATLSTAKWLRTYGDGLPQGADAVAVAPDGSIIIAGHYQGTLAITGATSLSASGASDIFVAKLNP